MQHSLDLFDTRKIGLGILIVTLLVLASIMIRPANADAVLELKVIYTQGTIISGPLSFSLSALPAAVTATYTLGPGTPSTEPGEENDIFFAVEDIVTATVSFGDTTWVSSDLESFTMLLSSNVVNTLTYAFLPAASVTVDGPVILNFPLSITGTDSATNTPFEYEYAESTQILTPIVQTVTVAIDIKPGDDPNCFNINGHGVIPVAVLGSADFDVGQIDLDSIAFGGLAVRVRGNKGPLCSIEYSNDDGYQDLVCHFEDDADNWEAGNGEAKLTGNLFDGTSFEGSDSICIVP